MRTIRYKEIDGHKIVIGFDRLRMDPVATMKKVDAEIVKTDEYEKQEQAISAYKAIRTPQPASETQRKTGLRFDPVDFARYQRERKEADALVRACADKLGEKREEYVQAFKTFFCPRSGEVVALEEPTDQFPDVVDPELADAIETASKAAPRGKAIRIDGEALDDLRGNRYYKVKGDTVEEIEIKKLGDKKPKGALLESELTELQARILERKRKKDAAAGLTPEQRAAKAKEEIDLAAAEAARYRSEQEIRGVTAAKALKEAQAQFEAEKDMIEEVYGV